MININGAAIVLKGTRNQEPLCKPIVQDISDAQGSARDHVETEWAKATEGIPGRETADIPQKKKKRQS